MHAGRLASGRSLAPLVLAALIVLGCGGAAQRRPAGTPAAGSNQSEASATPAVQSATPWPHAKVLRSIAGRRIRVDGTFVRVDPTTVTCGGLGPPAANVGSQAAWKRFRCVQPTFPRGAVAGPDAIFFLEPRGQRAFEITRAHFTRY